MALNFDQISAITEKIYLQDLADNIYNSNALLARMARPDKLRLKDGGQKIVAPVIYSEPNQGGFFSDLDTLSTNRTDNITAAEYEWRQAHEPIRISVREMRQNNGDAAKLSLVESKVRIARRQMKETLADGLQGDNTAGDEIDGLGLTLSDSSTYGGIAVADFSGWAAVIKDNSSTDRQLSLGLIQQTMGAASEDDDKPTVAVMRQEVFNEVHALLTPFQRTMSEEMAKLGFGQVLEYNGIPFLIDSHVPQGEIQFLNEDYLFLCVHSDENMRVQTIEDLETSASMLMRILWMGNLVCNNRRFQAKLDDISVAS